MARASAAPRLPVEALNALRLAASLHDSPVFLVGGAVRDLWLQRPLSDLDLACRGARALARKLARTLNGKGFPLDEAAGIYRVALPAASGPLRQLDVAELQGDTIVADLARRDFPLNALALPLSAKLPASVTAKSLLDLRHGLADIAAHQLRCENEGLFKDDPLRLLRAFRIAAQLDFEIAPQTLSVVSRLRHRIRSAASERVQAELMLLLGAAGSSRWLHLLDQTRLLTALIPELEPARLCAEEYYGKGGVMRHSLDTCERADFLLSHIGRVFPEQAKAIEEQIKKRSQGGQPFSALVMLAALLHDVAKPQAAKTVDGRLRFFGHDTAGARQAGEILRRLRFSNEQAAMVVAVIGNHLRPGNLAASGPITPKAVYRFFRDLGGNALPLLLVCWADHASYLPQQRVAKALKAAALDPESGRAALSRLKPRLARKTIYHLQVVSLLVRRLLDEKRKPVPARLLDGHAVMKALHLKPGPEVGEWLERLGEAQAEGHISTREEALAFLARYAAL